MSRSCLFNQLSCWWSNLLPSELNPSVVVGEESVFWAEASEDDNNKMKDMWLVNINFIIALFLIKEKELKKECEGKEKEKMNCKEKKTFKNEKKESEIEDELMGSFTEIGKRALEGDMIVHDFSCPTKFGSLPV